MDYKSYSHGQLYMWFKTTMSIAYVVIFFMFWHSILATFGGDLNMFRNKLDLIGSSFLRSAKDNGNLVLILCCDNVANRGNQYPFFFWGNFIGTRKLCGCVQF